MKELFDGLDYVRTCIDDLLIISNRSLEDHIKQLDKDLNKSNSAGFKVNAENPFRQKRARITRRQGIIPLPDKVEALSKFLSLLPRNNYEVSQDQ